ncbi:MAG: hypothetical protein ACYDBT_15150 [Desulfobulbaceae bacterium]
MSSGEQQLQADHALVKKLLSEYPSIKLIATKGEPPEQYDIEYHIKGYKANPDGTVLPANKHLVRISLPFGYPHFPPTAKPLSPIFHPDIDPDAIRIADFWKDSKSLPQLILHIGQMICGTFYSGDPFNQRAFDWFEERKSWMPFDILEPYEGDDEDSFVRTSRQTSGQAAPTGEAPAAAPPEEEISLDFAVEGEPVQMGGDEIPELDNLLDGELSFAFDLDAENDETARSSGNIEDLTALPEDEALTEIEFELSEMAGTAEDLTGLQDEAPSLDLGLGLEPEQPNVQHQFEDQAGDQRTDFNVGFEPLAEEAITLGDFTGIGEENLGAGPLPATEDTTVTGAAADDQPIPEDFVVDFGIEGATQGPAAPESLPEPAPEEGMLGGISLQLDEEHGKKFGAQARSIRPLIEQKEIFTAKRVLADIADPGSIPDREELEMTIAAAINEAEELYKKADKLEQKGELEKAGLLLDLVANIATDYPGLDFARNRIRESMMEGGQIKTPGEEARKSEGGQAGDSVSGTTAAKKASLQLRGKVPYKLLGVLVALGAVAGGGTALYFKDSATLATAKTEYNKGRQSVEKKEFKEAEKAFNTARSELGTVLFFGRGDKEELSRSIDSIVNEQTFKEGLQGKVLYNGQYVTIETAKAIDSFNLHVGSAEQARQAGKIDQAIAAYEKSLEYAETAGFQDKAQDIKLMIGSLRLEETLSLAHKAEEENEWKKAAETYQQAMELSTTLAGSVEQGEIANRQAAAALRHELEGGQRAFTASEWQKAVDMLQRAQKIIADRPTLVAEAEQLEINTLLINARVYQILADAKSAFTQKDWDGAVREYNRAIALLRENEPVLGRDEVADSVGKIEKTVLMTLITREEGQMARGATDSSTIAANLDHYRTIVALIDKSSLRDDTVLREIQRDSRAQIVNLEQELLVTGKVAYLKENYETIFRASYPSAKSSELLNPQVTFVKREGNLMIFTMSCAERNQGRTFRLELNYQYDLDKNSWSFYSGKL